MPEDTCYLCGLPREGETTRDHVPPQQLWAPEIRRTYNIANLITVTVHAKCNARYGRDEEYAIRMLSAAAHESLAGRSLFEHGMEKARRGQAVGLHRALSNGLDPRPGGLFLPKGRIVLNVDGARIQRVMWKLIRGLWYLDRGTALPESVSYLIEVQEPENLDRPKLEAFWNRVRAEPSQGLYQAVFAHKYFRFEEEGNLLHGWAMLLWERVIVYCLHYDPDDKDPRARRTTAPST